MARKKAAPKSELPLGDGPGVGRVVIKELDELADTYKRIRDRRQDLTKKEVESKERLTAAMHKHEKIIGKDPDGAMRYVYVDESSATGRSVVETKPTDEQTKVKPYVDPGEPE